MAYEEIADIMRIHWRGVQAIEQRALAKIKRALKAEGVVSLSDLLSLGYDEDSEGEESE